MTTYFRGRGLSNAAALALILALVPTVAAAQIFKLCGDVDDNDAVTVTDGVQVLRAAAGLSSDCTAAVCDVDVNGSVGVTDGVIVLRKAAGLPITENCIPDDGNIDQQVAHLIQRTEPLVSDVLPTMLQHVNETVDGTSFECDNGEDGTYDVSFSDGQQDTSFSDCLVDNTLINGDVENANDDPILSVEIGDVRTEETLSLEGSNGSALLGINIEGGVKYSGRLDASPSFERFDTGDFLLVVQNLQVGATGFPLGGTLQFVPNEDTNLPNVSEIRIFFDGSNLARVLVSFDDGSFKSYKFELQFQNFI
jgi:hypothetical protein